MSNYVNFYTGTETLIGNVKKSVQTLTKASHVVNFLRDDKNKQLVIFGLLTYALGRKFECLGSNRKTYDNSRALACMFELSTTEEAGEIASFLGHFIAKGAQMNLSLVTSAMRKACTMTPKAKFDTILNGGQYGADVYPGYPKLSALLESKLKDYEKTIDARIEGGVEIGGVELITNKGKKALQGA